jgi:adenylate cyclase
MSETRKLAAILAADVAGYSRLMGEDEAGTAKAVRERREAATPIVRSFGGRLVKTMGDGVLLEFPSVVAAVECAIAIQKLFAERNAGLAEGKRILYRVGVNLGDVLIEGDDILGDGVNVAARLEQIAEPGGVCLSGSAYDHVRGRVEANFIDLGEQRLKNIAEPVRAYSLSEEAVGIAPAPSPGAPPSRTRGVRAFGAVLVGAFALALIAAGWIGWRAWTPRAPAASVTTVEDKLATAPRLCIVVLPFENLSGDKEQEYFADGITDDLTTDLSHLPDSFVIARGTAFTYKGRPIDVKQIGRELGVRYAFEGSVRRVGETITVNAQLISTETGAHVWADRFDGERSKLGELQVDIVARLANSLGVELVKVEALRAMRERPNNPDAVDLAMQGWAAVFRGFSKDSFKDAIATFEHALALDPKNVSALTGLALLSSALVMNHWSEDPPGDIARADETADTALALQPDNSIAHIAKAHVFFTKRQWGPAIAQAEAAIADDRNNAWGHAYAGYFKMFLGHSEDGFADLETALRLSPHDSGVPYWQSFTCELHDFLAHWEQAIEWCNKAIAGNPEQWWAFVHLAAANAWAGHDKEAKDAAAQLQKVDPGFTLQTFAGIHWTDDPTFNSQYQRVVEGLRKAGLPEGEKPSGATADKSN